MTTYRIDYHLENIREGYKPEPLTGLSLNEAIRITKNSATNTEGLAIKWSVTISRE